MVKKQTSVARPGPRGAPTAGPGRLSLGNGEEIRTGPGWLHRGPGGGLRAGLGWSYLAPVLDLTRKFLLCPVFHFSIL